MVVEIFSNFCNPWFDLKWNVTSLPSLSFWSAVLYKTFSLFYFRKPLCGCVSQLRVGVPASLLNSSHWICPDEIRILCLQAFWSSLNRISMFLALFSIATFSFGYRILPSYLNIWTVFVMIIILLLRHTFTWVMIILSFCSRGKSFLY